MKKLLYFLPIITILFLATSCATIFYKPYSKVTITGRMPTADKKVNIRVEGKKPQYYSNVTLPYDIKVERGFEGCIVEVVATGCKPEYIRIDKAHNAYTWLNVFNAFTGVIVDLATGSFTRPQQKSYSVYFKPAAK